MKDISNQGSKLLILLITALLFSCSGDSDSIAERANKHKDIAQAQVNPSEYEHIYNLASDSINMWSLNKVGYFAHYGSSKKYQLDSLLCFNKDGSRFISCLLMQQMRADGVADDINYLYGQKIANKWYYNIGENIFLVRSLYGENPKQPMNFSKLHAIAIKEVYSGYLDSFGNINEGWFKQRFENVGMCADCKMSEEFKQHFYLGAMAQWANRDTTQPIKHLEKTLP